MANQHDLQVDCLMARRIIMDAIADARENSPMMQENSYYIGLRLRYPNSYLHEFALDCARRFIHVRRVSTHFLELQALVERGVRDADLILHATLHGIRMAHSVMAAHGGGASPPATYSKRPPNDDDTDDMSNTLKRFRFH
jgi:hypothetical protein